MHGEFLPASKENLYLASIDVAWSAPPGLGLIFVNPEDRNSADREALFKWLGLKELTAIDICHKILKTHETWPHGSSNTNLSLHLKNAKLKCYDGVIRPLDQVAIPTKGLLEACPHLFFADLSDPDSTKWQYLSEIKVATGVNDFAYLRELEVLSKLRITTSTLEHARRACQYKAQNRRRISWDTRVAFESKKKLVYHPSRGWLSLQDCVWKSANPLENKNALAGVYPECDDFFRGFLKIKDAGISEVVKELK
ncbi:hypothetical protein LZ31DRAFT_591337 [Colletotrichum somersetense]|nr:hypothetical protein LZ31DRAFT_591337 [Colletotrichum somersetense]